MSRGMQTMQQAMSGLNGSIPKEKRTYTPQNNEDAAVFISKKFIAYLANEDFFDQPVVEHMTSQQAQLMDECLKRFIGLNKIMKTPVGPLCSRHIYAFINNLFDVQVRGKHKFSKFDIIAMLPDYKGADHV